MVGKRRRPQPQLVSIRVIPEAGQEGLRRYGPLPSILSFNPSYPGSRSRRACVLILAYIIVVFQSELSRKQVKKLDADVRDCTRTLVSIRVIPEAGQEVPGPPLPGVKGGVSIRVIPEAGQEVGEQALGPGDGHVSIRVIPEAGQEDTYLIAAQQQLEVSIRVIPEAGQEAWR